MRHPSPGHHKSVAAFRAHLQGLDPAFDCVDDLLPAPEAALSWPLQLWGRTLHNRYVCHPMEGWDAAADGRPSAHTLRRWQRFGASGAAMIWGGEAFAVQADGRANPRQLYLNEAVDVVASLAGLREEVLAGGREQGDEVAPLMGLQLTHSGRFSRPEGDFAPRIAARHPYLEQRYPASADVEPLTDLELEGIGERYVAAARLAAAAGFDFVDIKCCHGYLLHELLGAKTRPGPYGGDLQGRTRLLRRIIEAVRVACPQLQVGVRVSIADLVPFVPAPETRVGQPVAAQAGGEPGQFGFGISSADPAQPDLAEGFGLLGLLQDLGVQAVNLTLGSPYYNPHLQRPAAYPPSDGYLPPRDPLAEVLCHLRLVRQCKAAFPQLVMVGTGYTYLQEFLPHVAEHEVGAGHVDCIGLGRMLLVYPDLPRDHLAGRPLQRKRICRTFSDCTTAPRNGMISGCYPLDPYYKAMPESARVKGLRS